MLAESPQLSLERPVSKPRTLVPAEKVKADPGMVQSVREFTGLPDA